MKVLHLEKKHTGGRPKALSDREVRKIKIQLAKCPHSSSKTIFIKAGLPNVSKTTRNRVLKRLGNVRNRSVRPHLTKKHKLQRVDWAKKYHTLDFVNVLWTDESRVTLDGPDGWTSGWLLHQQQPQVRVVRQQGGGGGVMIWAGII